VDRGVVLSRAGAVALEEIEVDAPGPGEVLVRVEATGVCHTDLHVLAEDGWGHRLPVLLGHEGAGTVEAVGEGVEGVAAGDRVVIGWKTACGRCPRCVAGSPRLCKAPPAAPGRLRLRDGTVLTPVLRTGTLATRTVVPAVAVAVVPRELPVEQACLLGCAVATGVMSVLETARVPAGARVAVIGCGAVGLSVVRGARIAGAAQIRAFDLDERKLEHARRAGAERGRADDAVDFAFDVVGRRETFELALSLLAAGGTAVLIGLSPAGEAAEVDLPRLFAKRARILVSHGGDHLPEDFPRLARWALEGTLDLASLVTRVAPLEEWSQALDAMRRGDAVRTVLTP
jgi:Zn-dependent alcohol dehydrogenase